jgi:hypothetical protein
MHKLRSLTANYLDWNFHRLYFWCVVIYSIKLENYKWLIYDYY